LKAGGRFFSPKVAVAMASKERRCCNRSTRSVNQIKCRCWAKSTPYKPWQYLKIEPQTDLVERLQHRLSLDAIATGHFWAEKNGRGLPSESNGTGG